MGGGMELYQIDGARRGHALFCDVLPSRWPAKGNWSGYGHISSVVLGGVLGGIW